MGPTQEKAKESVSEASTAAQEAVAPASEATQDRDHGDLRGEDVIMIPAKMSWYVS